ncbi:hypothetical protein [Roseisolibacter agri]|uniref:Uncharacterized protein n=1 Tax=Roseisolibacter agri TaxID=2014610 RepID=A0AA37VEF0_9BACT|nr:hypothetical protein [Roseisolibacter agri]GLC25034.1 hypothetical protein rosag_15470 [Roseisolibacter agri]
MPTLKTENDQQQLLAAADALTVAAGAAKGLARANLEVDLGERCSLPYKRRSKLQEKRDIAEDRFRAAVRRVAPALLPLGVEI